MKDLLDSGTKIKETVELFSKLASQGATDFMMGGGFAMFLAAILLKGFTALSQTEYIFTFIIGTVIIPAAAFIKTYQFTLILRQKMRNAEMASKRLDKTVDADLDITKKTQETVTELSDLHL